MTRKSKRTQLIFWLIIIGLLISMLIAFTPTLNGLFGGGQQAQQQGEPALVVNGETVYSLEVAQTQQNPPFNMGFEGEVENVAGAGDFARKDSDGDVAGQ